MSRTGSNHESNDQGRIMSRTGSNHESKRVDHEWNRVES